MKIFRLLATHLKRKKEPSLDEILKDLYLKKKTTHTNRSSFIENYKHFIEVNKYL